MQPLAGVQPAERDNLDIMVKMLELYKMSVDRYENNLDYMQIDNQVTKLRKKDKEEKKKELAIYEKKDRAMEGTKELQEYIDKYNFYMTSTGGLSWYYQPEFLDEYGNREWRSLKKETLLANFAATDVYIRGGQGVPDYSSFKVFNKMLVDQKRVFTTVIQSFTKDTSNGKLNIMNKEFCEPLADGSIDYHWFLDAIFESLSGGCPGEVDTFEHLQQIIFAKFLHPENIFIPCPMINDDGSSAKGLTGARFLPTLFSGSIADNCNIEHLTGKFNGVIAGKAIIFINETAKDKVDNEKVKSFIGSPTFTVEEKFEKPYSCDNTGLVISATNQTTGGITLSGTNSDRRYSIFSTKMDIYKIVQKYFLDKEQKKITLADAQDWIEETGQWILADKDQVGKWINAMVTKHGDIKHVRANKGKAYVNLIDRQRAGWTKTLDDIFGVQGFVYIREQLLRDLIKEYNKSEKFLPGRNKMQEDIEKYCKDKGWNISLVQRATIKPLLSKGITIQRTIWSVNGVQTVTEDEDEYGVYDQNSNWKWKWRG